MLQVMDIASDNCMYVLVRLVLSISNYVRYSIRNRYQLKCLFLKTGYIKRQSNRKKQVHPRRVECRPPMSLTSPPLLPQCFERMQRHVVKNSFIVELCDNHRKLRHLFLFNDVIVCAKYKVGTPGLLQRRRTLVPSSALNSKLGLLRFHVHCLECAFCFVWCVL